MSNGIKIGNLDISAFKVGSGDCSIYLGDILLNPHSPTPTGSTCFEIISTPITSYTSTTYDSVYSFSDSKWYMLNNLNAYEEYGVYDFVEDISSATTYEGKLGVVGETEYQYSGGSWSVVGSYVDSSVTYTIDDTDPSPYVGQELSTTFKIPYADVESVGFVNLRIRSNDGDDFKISLDTGGITEYSYQGNDFYQGTVTNDGEYFYLSLPSEAPQSIVIVGIEYWDSTPIHLIVASKQVTVEYEEKDMPLGDVYDTVAEMETVGCPTVGVGQYGVVGNNIYQFDGEDWNSVSNYKLMEKNDDGKANVLVCNSSTDLVNTETLPSYFGDATSITYAEIGNCVTSIGDWVFGSWYSLTSVTIGSGVTTIGNYAFYTCRSLTSVNIPSSVTSIGDWAFGSCYSLTSCTIGSGVTSIGENTFFDCHSLSSVTIPNSVTTIGKQAFQSCSGLTSITVEATTPPTLGNNAFDYTNNCPIYVPAASVSAYQSAWSSYASRIVAIQ